MTKEDKYKETKECSCIACGKTVTVTKFASAAKVLCDECKHSGAQPNPEILASVTKKTEPRSKYGGETKECPCIKCGTMTIVTKFASAAKVLCDECKDDGAPHSGGMIDVKIDMSKLDRNVIPPIEEYIAAPALVANSALRNVMCPACKYDFMKMFKILDWSSNGLIIHYQCPKCKLVVSISEQTKHMIGHMSEGTIFDYTGHAIEDLANSMASTRANNAIQRLMSIIKEHNITIEGEKLPPYLYENKRPVPIGYRIPRDDMAIKAIDDTIRYLDGQEEAIDLIMRLKELFKTGEIDV